MSKTALLGASLGAAAGLLRLGQAAAGGLGFETALPGILAIVFALVGAWGAYMVKKSSRGLRPLLGGALGGLIAIDIWFLPAAVLFVVVAVWAWRSK